jgi:uncharacterized membrane protein (DUF373 family)
MTTGEPPEGSPLEQDEHPRGAARVLSYTLQEVITRTEGVIYLLIGALLIFAAGYTIIGTVADIVKGGDQRPVADTGVFVLERVLLIFIIAELLYTLRLVDVGGRILVEPFLFIGLIAVVRRVLIITAELERPTSHQQMQDLLVQIGALGGLTLVLALALYLLRARPR